MKKVELRKKLAIIAGMGIMACSLAACGGSKSDTTAATTKESVKEDAKSDKKDEKKKDTTEEKKEKETEENKEETTEEKKEETTEEKKEEATEEAVEEETEEVVSDNSGQNPVMNFIGKYVHDRASITVSAKGDDEAEFFVTWSGSASTHSEWTMSGKYDAENCIVVYTNCTKKSYELNEDGSIASETTDYENGMGSFEFMYPDGDTVLKWDDAEEAVASEMVFEYNR